EAMHLDPRQRVLVADVSAAWTAAATTTAKQRTNDVAVFTGVAGKDYALLLKSCGVQIGTFTGTGNEASVTCGRVMFSLGFTGASAAIDTACSSSLVAASFALDAVRRSFDGLGRVDRAPRTAHAFAAGASLMLTPDMHLTLGGAGMLSHFGRCMTLDASADGYGRGEACACVLIACGDANEREEDEDTIKGDAVVAFAGSAVNQDGRSSSLTAPNGPSQRAVVREAAFGFGSGSGSGSGAVTEERVGGTRLLQMHGTGTPLGDP
ncbi:uncharacterized protein MICPUCDRAFT_11321, partial [Micromonas pusilla CCMP1545]